MIRWDRLWPTAQALVLLQEGSVALCESWGSSVGEGFSPHVKVVQWVSAAFTPVCQRVLGYGMNGKC